MKKCSRCEQTKPLDCFNKKQVWCRDCQKEYKAKWRQANKERIQEYNAQWHKANREQIQEQKAEYNTKIPPGVYEILNKETDWRYIGESKKPIQRRSEHWTKLRGGYHENPNLQQDYNKFGEDAFVFEILECPKPDALLDCEAYWINKYKDCCYNIYKT